MVLHTKLMDSSGPQPRPQGQTRASPAVHRRGQSPQSRGFWAHSLPGTTASSQELWTLSDGDSWVPPQSLRLSAHPDTPSHRQPLCGQPGPFLETLPSTDKHSLLPPQVPPFFPRKPPSCPAALRRSDPCPLTVLQNPHPSGQGRRAAHSRLKGRGSRAEASPQSQHLAQPAPPGASAEPRLEGKPRKEDQLLESPWALRAAIRTHGSTPALLHVPASCQHVPRRWQVEAQGRGPFPPTRET